MNEQKLSLFFETEIKKMIQYSIDNLYENEIPIDQYLERWLDSGVPVALELKLDNSENLPEQNVIETIYIKTLQSEIKKYLNECQDGIEGSLLKKDIISELSDAIQKYNLWEHDGLDSYDNIRLDVENEVLYQVEKLHSDKDLPEDLSDLIHETLYEYEHDTLQIVSIEGLNHSHLLIEENPNFESIIRGVYDNKETATAEFHESIPSIADSYYSLISAEDTELEKYLVFDGNCILCDYIEDNFIESAPPLTAKTVMGSAPDKIEISSEMEM